MNINKLKIGLYFLMLFMMSCGTTNKNQKLGVTHIAKLVFINPAENGVLSAAENNDVKSFKRSLNVIGLNVAETNVTNLNSIKLQDFDLMIIPYASAKDLKDDQIKLISGALNSGVNLLFDGISKLNEALEIKSLQKSVVVNRIRDVQFSKNPLYWTIPGSVTPFDTVSLKHQILCIDDSLHLPIVICGKYGKGKFISMAALFDPNTDKGYSRFPFLAEYLNQVFGIEHPAERLSMEMYFDPGIRDFNKMRTDSVVNQWRKHKIKRIYAGGWYYDTDYDYAHLIKACHENGISVYCWLETPMISIKFWKDHPEWREKTAYLKDAQIDWRYLMNLADENCRKQACKEIEDFLMNLDWDGVDFAEMYFEPSPVGPELPENFTPKNNTVREEFKKQAGFDPIDIFDTKSPHYWKQNKADWRTFADYRKGLCYRIKTHFLDCLTNISKKKKDFEVVLTVIDVSLTPEVSDNIGEDTKNTLSLCQKYNITLQSEDPSSCWGLTPERYDKMGQLYRQNIKEKNKLIFDCNVVSAHEKGFGGFPSEIPSGEEIRQIAHNMALHEARPCFYSEDALYERDFKNISMVLANRAMITAENENRWTIKTPYTVIVKTGTGGYGRNLDGKEWFAGDSINMIVPAGEHTINFFSSKNDPGRFRILNISSELQWAKFEDHSLEFSYSEDFIPCYVTINKLSDNILIDNILTQCAVFSNKQHEFTIRLPQGIHVVKMVAK